MHADAVCCSLLDCKQADKERSLAEPEVAEQHLHEGSEVQAGLQLLHRHQPCQDACQQGLSSCLQLAAQELQSRCCVPCSLQQIRLQPPG